MTKSKTDMNQLLEYMPLTLILSYFINHNIFIVLVGTLFSLYLINKNKIYSLIKYINTSTNREKVDIDLKKKREPLKNDSKQIKLIKEESTPELVEIIEELGYIPSQNKYKDIKAK